MVKRLALIASGLLGFVSWATPLHACSVCFGDPESDMARGAVAGIYVLGGIIGFVLVCVATTGAVWFHRGRSMSRSLRNEDLRASPQYDSSVQVPENRQGAE